MHALDVLQPLALGRSAWAGRCGHEMCDSDQSVQSGRSRESKVRSDQSLADTPGGRVRPLRRLSLRRSEEEGRREPFHLEGGGALLLLLQQLQLVLDDRNIRSA